MYIKFTNVDSKTGISIQREPAANGPSFPQIPGLVYEFALESQYPIPEGKWPTFYGTCPDNVPEVTEGILAVITKEQHDADRAAEMNARLVKAKTEAFDRIANKRWNVESAGILITKLGDLELKTPITVQTGVADQNRISIALTECERYNMTSVKFKCANNTWVEMSYEHLKIIGGYVATRVQACFAKECDHATNVAALTSVDAVNTYDYSTGWPA